MLVRAARTLEPTYDLAAATGETNPSPQPSPDAQKQCTISDTQLPDQSWDTSA